MWCEPSRRTLRGLLEQAGVCKLIRCLVESVRYLIENKSQFRDRTAPNRLACAFL